jgi:hypothetical protein
MLELYRPVTTRPKERGRVVFPSLWKRPHVPDGNRLLVWPRPCRSASVIGVLVLRPAASESCEGALLPASWPPWRSASALAASVAAVTTRSAFCTVASAADIAPSADQPCRSASSIAAS